MILAHRCRSFRLEIVDFTLVINFVKFDYERIFINNFRFDWSIIKIPQSRTLCCSHYSVVLLISVESCPISELCICFCSMVIKTKQIRILNFALLTMTTNSLIILIFLTLNSSYWSFGLRISIFIFINSV